MKDLTHQNINTFIGACVEPGNICILSQYCAKGSLQVTKNLQNPALKCCSTSTLHIYITCNLADLINNLGVHSLLSIIL